MSAPLLELRGVRKRYGSLLVVDDMSFALAAGEALGVVGPNGAGKTTLMNLVAGSVRPDAGRVAFDGADVAKLPQHARCRLGIGRTHQVPRPFAGLTVFENALVGARFGRAAGRRSSREAEEAGVEALCATGLLPKANHLAGSLTLLERKRLELARALAVRPRLLLLDEIAGGLTEAEVHELVDAVKALRAQGIALVWIEHIVHALLSVVDRLLAMDYGKLLVEGEPAAVMASPEVRRVYLGVEEVAAP